MVIHDQQRAKFLNVDLEIDSAGDLQPLLESVGGKLLVLHCGRIFRTYCARLELPKQPKSADAAIRGLCAVVSGLDKKGRELWNGAKRRNFSIGIQAGAKPHSHDFPLQPATVKAVAELGAGIIFTVYAPDPAG